MTQPISKQKETLFASFKPDRRFLTVCLLEILLIASIFLAVSAWSWRMTSIGQNIEQLKSQLESLGGFGSAYSLQVRDNTAVEIFNKVIFSTILFSVFAIAAWTFMKSKVYNSVNGISFSLRNYWRFLVFSIAWNSVAFFIFMFAQYFVYVWLGDSFEFSWLSRISVFVLLLVIATTLFWFTIAMFTPLVKECRIMAGIRGLWTGVKSFGRFVVPLLVSLIVMAAINLVMLIILFFGKGWFFVVTSTLLLVAYITWMRFYFTSVLFPAAAVASVHKEKKMPAQIKRHKNIEGGKTG
jgi:hypothetical protein